VVLVEAMRVAVGRGLAAEERFRSAQEVSLDAFVILEPVRESGRVVDFRWTYVNPMADSMRPTGVSTLLGRRVLDVFRDATGSDMVARMSRLLETGGPDDIDVRRTIDGEERVVRSSGVRLGNDLAVTFRDVTHERRAAAALRSSEELFRSLANSAPVLIWATSAHGHADWFNQALAELPRTHHGAGSSAGGGSAACIPTISKAGLEAADLPSAKREPFNIAFRMKAGRRRLALDQQRRRAPLRRVGRVSRLYRQLLRLHRDGRGPQGPGGSRHRTHRGPGSQHGRDRPRPGGSGAGPAPGDGRPADRRRGA
jgi:PAS domain-containing protein